jgi:hypothetical protein
VCTQSGTFRNFVATKVVRQCQARTRQLKDGPAILAIYMCVLAASAPTTCTQRHAHTFAARLGEGEEGEAQAHEGPGGYGQLGATAAAPQLGLGQAHRQPEQGVL